MLTHLADPKPNQGRLAGLNQLYPTRPLELIRGFAAPERFKMNENIGVFLDVDEQRRLDNFLSDLDLLLGEGKPNKYWRKLFGVFRRLQDYSLESQKGIGYFPEGYVDLLNDLSLAKRLTGLPYSLEADNAGLPSLKAWDEAVAAALTKAGAAKVSAGFRKFCND